MRRCVRIEQLSSNPGTLSGCRCVRCGCGQGGGACVLGHPGDKNPRYLGAVGWVPYRVVNLYFLRFDKLDDLHYNMSMDIYGLTLDEIVGLIEEHEQRFSRILDKNLLRLGVSWLRYKAEMRKRGQGALVDEIMRLDNEYLNERLRNDVIESYSKGDAEGLKLAKEAIAALTGREKLVGGESTGDDGSMAMTINITGEKGGQENS